VLGLFLDHDIPIGVFAVTAVALAVCIVLAYALQRAGIAQSALAVRPAE
jgi:hypothetical protein